MFKRISIPLMASLLVVAGATAALADVAGGNQSWRQANHDKDHGGRGFLGGDVAKQLNLTADQQARIKAIKAKYRENEQQEHATGNDFETRLKTALTAPTVDQNQLRSLLSEKQSKHGQGTDKFVSMWSEIRAVLTPDQREKLAAMDTGKGFMGHGRGHGGGMMGLGHAVKDLKLTPAQQQAADELKAQMKNNREAMKTHHDQLKTAFANFIRNGDQGALRSALQANQPVVPVDALVKFYASLDQSQRAQLAAHMGEEGQRNAGRNHRGHRRGNGGNEAGET